MACMGEMIGAYRVLVGKSHSKNNLEDIPHMCRWENNIKMDLQTVLNLPKKKSQKLVFLPLSTFKCCFHPFESFSSIFPLFKATFGARTCLSLFDMPD